MAHLTLLLVERALGTRLTYVKHPITTKMATSFIKRAVPNYITTALQATEFITQESNEDQTKTSHQTIVSKTRNGVTA